MRSKLSMAVRITVFLLCLIMLYNSISEIMRKKTGGRIDMIHSFYDLKEDSVDVLVLGSSHAYYGFQPNVLWEEQGYTSYVMGSPEQTIASSYFLLREALKYQRPKVVLLESYFFWYDGLYTSEGRVHAVLDGMRFGKVKQEALNVYRPDLSWKEKASWYLPFMMYHNRWGELEEEDFDKKSYLKGSKPDKKVVSCKDQGVDMEPVDIPKINVEYFNKIMELCEQEKMQLVVFAAPYAIQKGERYRKRQGVNLTLESYLHEKNIPFLFFQKTGEADIDFQNDFRDRTHLNWKGQKKITACIGEFLYSKYGLESHAGEAEYTSWDEDYEQYHEEFK